MPGQDLGPLRRFVAEAPGVDTIDEYVDVLGDTLIASATSPTRPACSARGCRTARAISTWTGCCRGWHGGSEYLVTETLEPDNNRADLMREARERALLALER